MRSGGATNNYTSGIVASLIELGLAKKHLDVCRNKYKVSERKMLYKRENHLWDHLFRNKGTHGNGMQVAPRKFAENVFLPGTQRWIFYLGRISVKYCGG